MTNRCAAVTVVVFALQLIVAIALGITGKPETQTPNPKPQTLNPKP